MMVGLLVVLNYYSDIPSTRRSKIDSDTILIKVKTDGWIVRTKSKVWIWLFLVCTEFKDLLLIITWIPFLSHRDQILVVNTIWLNWTNLVVSTEKNWILVTSENCLHRDRIIDGIIPVAHRVLIDISSKSFLSAQRQNYWTKTFFAERKH